MDVEEDNDLAQPDHPERPDHPIYPEHPEHPVHPNEVGEGDNLDLVDVEEDNDLNYNDPAPSEADDPAPSGAEEGGGTVVSNQTVDSDMAPDESDPVPSWVERDTDVSDHTVDAEGPANLDNVEEDNNLDVDPAPDEENVSDHTVDTSPIDKTATTTDVEDAGVEEKSSEEMYPAPLQSASTSEAPPFFLAASMVSVLVSCVFLIFWRLGPFVTLKQPRDILLGNWTTYGSVGASR